MAFEHCDEHLLQREKIDNLSKSIDELKELVGKSVTTVAEYIPKIESTLAQFLTMQETLKEAGKTHKELFARIDKLREDFYELKMKQEKYQVFMDESIDNRRDMRSLRNQIIAGVTVAVILMGIGGLFVVHDLKQDLAAVKVEQKK